jgi:predicted secreted hydrolase
MSKKSLFKGAVLIISLLFVFSCDVPQRPLDFPFDHGPHFNAVNEWWYFTGKVMTADDKTLGFEFTIFKRWVPGSNSFAYLGHLAVSNPETSEHMFNEVPTSPPVSGIEEGKAELVINNFSYRFSEAEGFSVKAETETLAVDLSLTPLFDVLPHGNDGTIIMGDGRISYYYSFTNLATSGTISVNGTEYAVVSGRTWMDHQWGNFTVLGMKWDWFSLRFDDDSALMLFQFRNRLDTVTRANWSYQSGNGSMLYGEEFAAQVLRTYTEEKGHSTYPVDWIINVPDLEAELRVRPLFDAQSLYDVMTPDYWEGLCSVEGTMQSRAVAGAAYVELTGYE